MKILRVTFALALSLFLAMPVVAGQPNNAVYSTYGGTLLCGRVSEAYCTATPGGGQVGNTQDAMSWNAGTGTLGGQWHLSGMSIAEPGAILNDEFIDEFGNGFREYITYYENGRFWLEGAHFGDGSEDYEGDITFYRVTTTMSIVGGAVVGATSNAYFTGVFDSPYHHCFIEYTIATVIMVWHPAWGMTMPSDYPGWYCGNTGELFDVCGISASIDCETATEESTWGAIKTTYRK
ncbi:MAG: hypothetical protein JW876_00930 [Candidatus Krumholzibacteriota bacterium]|nr:hypothetical protein [Candidatus Krumholzibacteriota bacterium]